MPEYNFERLGAKEFERLTNALASEHIARGLRIFGSGTDGGREATYQGKMNYPSAAEPWNGYLVVQCKQKESLGKTPKEDGQWAIDQLETEMVKYKTAKKKRRIPDYFLFVTNARLSAQLDTGGKDRFVERLNFWIKELGMRGADVWDRDKLTNLLDTSQKVAQRFGMLHEGDLIHYAAQAILAHREGVETTLSLFLQEELRADQFVNLAQAGHTNDDRTPLARVFVDLRAVSHGHESGFFVVHSVQQESDRPIHPTVIKQEQRAAEELLRELEEIQDTLGESEHLEDADFEADDYDKLGEIDADELAEVAELAANTPREFSRDASRHVVIGGPGQGKSTLAQHLAQRHRAALLKANATKPLEAETERILRVIEEAADESNIGLPMHPRWPFRVVLEQFADKLAAGEVASVLEYIAFMVRKRTKRAFEQQDAELLLATTPWFVAFDGLDEVPAVSNRTEVLNAVNLFLLEAHEKDADLLVVATTRPQGYEGEFGADRFNHMNLAAFSREEALVYAKKFVEAKYANDQDRQERIMQRLETAAQEEAIARLMQTPLQVTIMAALVDLLGNPPRERYQLFNRYYEIVYQREQERGLKLSDVLARYRSGIEILHDRIGLLLQIEAESAGKSQGRVTRDRLERLVHDYLVAEELIGEILEQTTADFMHVALHRLVFIAPLEDERYGFEVRSLQEFSAARALMRGDYSVVKNRLRRIAPMPYWRNTMLFAVGKAFAEQNEPLCDMITQLCRELNEAEDPVLFRTLAGSRLAVDILEDGVVEWRFRYRRLFFETALRLLYLPHAASVTRLAALYTPADEERYVAAALATAGSNEPEVALGLLTALTILGKNDEAAWADRLYKKLWPQELSQEQIVLEYVQKNLKWDDWTMQTIARVARASDMGWVAQHLSPIHPTSASGIASSPIRWIQDARTLRQKRSKKVVLAGKIPTFAYYIQLPLNKPEALERLREANPTHFSWLPYTVGREFMLNPSPNALADVLEAVAQDGNYNLDTGYHHLPWQLAALLNDAESAEELLHHTERARNGELGTAQDWQDAEKRWVDKGFTVDDLRSFSDAEWPFTAKVAHVGIQTAGVYGTLDEVDEDHEAVSSLLEAFNTMPSVRGRSNVAANIFFLAGYTYHPNNPLILPLATIIALAEATNWQVHVLFVISMLDPELDWVGEAKSLDLIGSRISSINNFEDPDEIAQRKVDVASQLLPLLGAKQVREGILRFIAALAATGVDVQVPKINSESLSPEGLLAFTAINLLTSFPTVDATMLAQYVLKLWTHAHPTNRTQDMPRVLQILFERAELSSYSITVLNVLYTSNVLGARTKQKIINSLMLQIQYRVSGLDNPAFKEELAMDWLFKLASA